MLQSPDCYFQPFLSPKWERQSVTMFPTLSISSWNKKSSIYELSLKNVKQKINLPYDWKVCMIHLLVLFDIFYLFKLKVSYRRKIKKMSWVFHKTVMGNLGMSWAPSWLSILFYVFHTIWSDANVTRKYKSGKIFRDLPHAIDLQTIYF